jgi:hypothetical protein
MNLDEMTAKLKELEKDSSILKVIRVGLLTGYAESADGNITFEITRKGGGFTVGTTYYEIRNKLTDANVLTKDPEYAYKTLLEELGYV